MFDATSKGGQPAAINSSQDQEQVISEEQAI